jgi:cathepsin L
VSIEENSYEGLMEALVTKGPIVVNVDASNWHSYESGVFTGCSQSKIDVNHVVQLVGYGTDPVHGDYWTIRNSWSPTYGENGYIRIQRTPQG